MPAYRFCRSDDIGLLVDALNRCWAPYVPDEPPMTAAVFKRSIRDLQVWCSSCMVACSGADPIGVLIGAKRASRTLVHRIAVRPDHLRQDHGRHLLASLGSKLAILGPPSIVAEVPDSLAPACGLFGASGYMEEARLTDYVLPAGTLRAQADARNGQFVIPVSVDDLAANGLLEDVHPQVCWERSLETLTARKADVAGLAVVGDERIEAYVLYATCGPASGEDAPTGPPASIPEVEVLSLRSSVDDGGARLTHLLARLGARGATIRFSKVHPAELSSAPLETLGFRRAGGHLRYTATARPA